MKNCMIIVNYNDFKRTKHLIDNVKEYKILDEVVIVDNGSTVSEYNKLEELGGNKITLLRNEDNSGYSSGINKGAKYLIEKYKILNIFVSNSDIIIFSESDLLKMLDCLSSENVGLVGAQILERGIVLRGRKDVSILKDYISNIVMHEEINNYSSEYYKGKKSKVDIISTAFFLIKSNVLQEINYMDTGVFLYYEDAILCKKVRKLGYKIMLSNEVKIKHLFGTSISNDLKSFEKKRMLNDSRYYYHLNYNKKTKLDEIILKILKKAKYK